MGRGLEILLMISMIVLALIAVYTPKLRRAAVYLGAFSLLCSFAFLLYNAPDVAIAEAVIGCTLSTIFYLIAIKKQHSLVIYYVEGEADDTIKKERRALTSALEEFFIKREFAPQFISTHLEDNEVCEKGCFDLLILHEKNDITIYSSGLLYITPAIREFLIEHKPPHLDVSFYCLAEIAAKEDMSDER